MRQSLWLFLAVIVASAGILVLIRGDLWSPTPNFRGYAQVRIGMSVEEVEAILGRGTLVHPDDVPCDLGPVRSDAAPRKRAASPAGPASPLPDSPAPTRPVVIRPVVEGDLILRWENARSGAWILVAFRNGRACQKDCWAPASR